MKKLIASAGLIAVGASGLQAAYAPGLSPMETAKPWSISATVRGFYDDNYQAVNKAAFQKRDSFGLQLSPSAAINIPLEQSYFGASYIYTMRYFEGRPRKNVDHTHEVTLKANHQFSSRNKLSFRDAFAYSQEPLVLQEAGSPASTFAITGDAMRNRAKVDFSSQLTDLVGIAPGYQNTWYDFLDSESTVGSRSALLDRIEHLFKLDGRYQVRETLVALLGYQFGIVDYTSKGPILADGTPGNIRDNQSQYFYLGADYALSSRLNVSGNAGVQYTTYDSLPGNALSPYFDLSGHYNYLPGSYAILGIKHSRNATYQAGTSQSDLVRDQESTVVYASVNHRITREVTASLLGQYQNGVFSGGSRDGRVDQFLLLGLNFEYRINENWAVETGYNFDRLDSDIGGTSFTRNRIYLGASATF